LKGDTAERKFQLVRSLGCLLELEVVHILISNSTDTGELLGSFEQVNEEGNGEPQFKYIDSRLVKALKQKNALVYVEVFADYMVERIEKGIPDIYDRKSRVIISCDGLNLQT
jgi:midasin (ATPase involved in ribosome maturation)